MDFQILFLIIFRHPLHCCPFRRLIIIDLQYNKTNIVLHADL